MASRERQIAALQEIRHCTPETAQIIIDDAGACQVEYAGINTLVVDIKGGPSLTMPDLDVLPGMLVYSREKCLGQYGLTEDHLNYADLGGQGNIVPIASRLGMKTGVIGYLSELDTFARFFRESLDQLGVKTDGLVPCGYPIGISIMTGGKGERSGIVYFPRANALFQGDDGEVREKVVLLNPVVAHNSYIGLSPDGWDKDNGTNAADLLAFQQDLGIITITDTHTFGSDEQMKRREHIPEYDLLHEPLRHTNIFVCSLAEARRIMGTWGVPFDGSSKQDACTFLDYLLETYDDGMPRLFGVSMRDGVVATNRRIPPVFIESPCASIAGVDLVGAGDSLKTGLGAYIVRHEDEFRDNNFNLAEALRFAQMVATIYISTPPFKRGVERFDDIPQFDELNTALEWRS